MTTRIMPLGASNTYGMYGNPSSPGGYRGPLHYMLQGTGADVDFVGLDRDGAITDPDHNGHSGKTIEWYTGPVNETIYDPNTGAVSHHVNTNGAPLIDHLLDRAGMTSNDVVLLLVGTNNVIAGDSAETMLAKAEVLLERIVNHASSPDVRLMKLQPVGGDWWEDGDAGRTNNDTIRIFNSGLDQLVSEKFAARGVEVVDSNATLADLRNDGVHLTEAGYRKTAGAWYDSLEGEFDFLPSRPTSPGSNAVASAVWTKEWFGGAKPDRHTGSGLNEYLDGGANGDTVTGKGGDDTYVVAQNNDRVVEELGGGVDTVLTTLTNYAAPAQVENVTVQTSARATLSGNELDNLLKGGGGADQINGGRGADQLFGGAAADVFVFRKGEARGDRVEDFQHGDALHFQGFSAGAVLVSRDEGVWSISDRDGVEVIQVAGRTSLTENGDYFFV